jgi:hypothetical protein
LNSLTWGACFGRWSALFVEFVELESFLGDFM